MKNADVAGVDGSVDEAGSRKAQNAREMVRKVPTADHLARATTLWGINEAPRFVRDITNFIYVASMREETVFVRLTSDAWRSRKLVHSELHWMRHLERRGVRVAPPVDSLPGRLVESVGDEDTGVFHVTVFREASGARVAGAEALTPSLIASWGAQIAHLHEATRSYTVPPGFALRPDWKNESMLASVIAGVRGGLVTAEPELSQAIAWMESLPVSPQTFGHVHADFHLGNFFVQENEITIFDFDDCCRHWFLYDLAVAVASAAFLFHEAQETAPLIRSASEEAETSDLEVIARRFAVGYATVRPFQERDLHTLLLFVRYRVLLVRLWGQVAFGADRGQNSMDWCVRHGNWCKSLRRHLPPFVS